MNVRETYQQALAELWPAFLGQGNADTLAGYLVEHSHLPGPRGNLELADAFSATVAENAAHHAAALWALCVRWASVPVAEAPTNSPREFLVFCGVQALGAWGTQGEEQARQARAMLRTVAGDARWRTREAVARALQLLLVAHGVWLAQSLREWIVAEDWLAMRAVVAGVAEPVVLRREGMAREALALHQCVCAVFLASQARRGEAFRVLRQGLAYSLSVVVSVLPEAGFAYLNELVALSDSDMRWIVAENLKKSRLLRPYPQQVAQLRAVMAEG